MVTRRLLTLALAAALTPALTATATATAQAPTATEAKARYSSGATAARVHKCRNRVGPTITITSTRNMLCRSAARVMRAHNRPISTSFKTSGYRCRRISGAALGGTWRCLKGKRGFRFGFGD
ncbi:MAG: hypothetical protein ACR2J6_07015 [Thermoleophilaceae bacterium]